MKKKKRLEQVIKNMNKHDLIKAVILGVSLSTTLGTTAQAGTLSPGDYTSDSAITLTTTDTAIDTSGTYNIKNSNKTLTINSEGNYHPIALHDKGTSVINGNIVLNMNNLPSEYFSWNHALLSNKSKLTLNGDLTVNSDSPNTTFKTTGRLIHVAKGSELTINGNVKMDITSYSQTGTEGSQTAFIADDSVINVNGDLCDIESRFKNGTPSSGANTVYAIGTGIINFNSTKTVIKSGGDKPDAISAKYGTNPQININSKITQVVGSIDFHGAKETGTVSAVFDGADSFWYGDLSDNTPNGTIKEGDLRVTFKNGATYIPFGVYEKNQYGAKKYLSAITLENGGIINLFDSNAQQKWADEGLLDTFPELSKAKLDYILLGNLKGSGGSFYLDMNDTDKSKTDMVYVLKDTGDSGIHGIQSYPTDSFNNINPQNTLRFATVAAAAADKVTFQDEINMYGKSLWDYKLKIGHSAYDLNDPENAIYNGNRDGLSAATIDTMMTGGMNWYVYDYVKLPVPSVVTAEAASDAAYGLWRYDDTLRKRLGDMRYMDGQKDGMWVRYRTNKTSADSFDGSNQMYQLGYDKRDGNTVYGVAADHTQGSNTFNAGSGKNSMTNVSVYATNYHKNGVYSDLVGRIGKVLANMHSHGAYNDYTDFNSWGYTLSYETGKTFNHSNGWFIEPETQLVLGRLNGSDSTSNYGFNMNRDAVTSVLGRLGVVLGRKVSDHTDYYMKANIYREFAGDGSMDFYYGKDYLHYDGNHKDTWYEIGLGGNVKINDNNYFYCDILKTFGADIQKKWQVNTGLRWTW
jgi:outer membrane autotransporter protein